MPDTDEYLRLLKEIDEQEELEEMPENLTREVIEGKLKRSPGASCPI